MNFNSKIAQMKVFATDKGINDLKKLIKFGNDTKLPIRLYRDNYDCFVCHEEEMTGKEADNFKEVLCKMAARFEKEFDNFKNEAYKEGYELV